MMLVTDMAYLYSTTDQPLEDNQMAKRTRKQVQAKGNVRKEIEGIDRPKTDSIIIRPVTDIK